MKKSFKATVASKYLYFLAKPMKFTTLQLCSYAYILILVCMLCYVVMHAFSHSFSTFSSIHNAQRHRKVLMRTIYARDMTQILWNSDVMFKMGIG